MPQLLDAPRTPYFGLYSKAKRLAWDPATVDLSLDRADWQRLQRDHAAERYPEQILQLCTLFHAGEESVTRTLAPYTSAVARAGLGVDLELHLAAQLFEEAKHYEFFARYFAEVFELDAATLPQIAAAPRAVLVDDLEEVSARLRHEDDAARLGDLLTEAITHYMGVVEAMLARTGYEGAHASLTERGWLPGLREGFRLIRRDEGRHVAFGMHAVRDLIAADPRRARIVQQTFERHLPNVVGTVRAFADYAHPLVDVNALIEFALGACRQFLAAAGLGDPADAAALERALAHEA